MRIELQYRDKKDIKNLREELENVENTHVKVKVVEPPERMAYFMPPPLPAFILIISLSANIATIADILYKYSRKTESKGVPKLFRFRYDGKEIVLKGNWSKKDIEAIFREFSETLSHLEKIKETEIIAKEKRDEMQRRLVELKEILPKYQELVQIGREIVAKKKGWKKKLEDYEETFRKLQQEKVILESLLKDSRTSGKQ